ncbi:hypothetical protein EG329_010830 [Mollisiaceae sp. DMI_Dod_QoI]|nr:hypothetical protein EG329_010830 [Helotiales sp. DMI_Dod_QoI]
MSSYTYQPIPSERSIRILRLEHAAKHDEELRGSFVTTVLEEAPEFTALSYVWGSSDLTARIWVDDQTISITDNLNVALKRFRLQDAPRLIWADGICIDQKNIPERNSQVKLMTSLYRRAGQTVAWLGEGDRDTAEAMSELVEIADSATNFNASQRGIRLPFKIGDIEMTEDVASALLLKAGAKGVQSFYERSWFIRVWVIQESVVSQKLTMFCGATELEWDIFAAATALLHNAAALLVSKYSIPMFRAVDNALELVLARAIDEVSAGARRFKIEDNPSPWSLDMDIHIADSVLNQRDTVADPKESIVTFGHSAEDFWERVWRFRRWQCSDDRDRVIGMMGFLPWSVPIKFTPDYSKTVVEVYTAFSHALLNIQAMDLLMVAGIRDRIVPATSTGPGSVNVEHDTCPSWVPELRLSKLNAHETASWRHPMHSHMQYRHMIDVPHIREAESPYSRKLVLEGIRLGLVSGVAWLTEPFSMQAVIKTLNFLWEMYREVAQGEKYHLTGEDHIEALAKTLGIILPSDEDESPGYPDPKVISRLQELLDRGDAVLAHLNAAIGDREHRRPPEAEDDKEMIRLLNHVLETLSKHTFFVTKNGYMGLSPGSGTVMLYDNLVTFHGSGAVFGLRRPTTSVEDVNSRQLVGHCYLHGFMEVIIDDTDPRTRGWITLV